MIHFAFQSPLSKSAVCHHASLQFEAFLLLSQTRTLTVYFVPDASAGPLYGTNTDWSESTLPDVHTCFLFSSATLTSYADCITFFLSETSCHEKRGCLLSRPTGLL